MLRLLLTWGCIAIWVPASGSQKAGGRLALQLLPVETVTRTGAVCLDGTPGGYYYAAAPPGSPNSSKWVWFIQGGGWCQNETDCWHRATHGGYLGSSDAAPLSLDPHSEVTVTPCLT